MLQRFRLRETTLSHYRLRDGTCPVGVRCRNVSALSPFRAYTAVAGRVNRPSVTLRDVARAAEVSISTASNALTGTGRVAPDTRRRVVETARRLDFRPNTLARSFVTGRSFTVGILAEHAPGTFSMPVLIGANSALGRGDLASLTYDAENDPALRREYLARLRARRVDGLLVVGRGPDAIHPAIPRDFPAPVVYAYALPEGPSEAVYLPDDGDAGRLAAQHLVDLGRTRVVHITAGSHLCAVRARLKGFFDVLSLSGIDLAAEPLHGTWRRAWGFEATDRLLASGIPFDAVFAGNDDIALGVRSRLEAAGRRIPDDVAIVGVDNFAGLTHIEDRSLTTIDLNLPRVGAAAAEHVRRAISGDHEIGRFTVPATLVAGRSTLGDVVTDVLPVD